MVALSLKISIGNVVKTMQFEPSTMVYDACRIIRERIPEALTGPRESDSPDGWGRSPWSLLIPRLLALRDDLLSPRATHPSGLCSLVPSLPFRPRVTGAIVRAIVQPFSHVEVLISLR